MAELVSLQKDNRILGLFNPVNIKEVVLVDNDLSVVATSENFLGKAKAVYDISKNESLKGIFKESFPNKAVLEKKLKEKFEGFSPEEKNTYYHKLNKLLGDEPQEDLERDLSSFVVLSEVFKDKVTFHKLSPEDWESQKKDIIKKVNANNKLLILFDKELGKGKNSRNYIDEIIEEKKFDGLIFCGLFTHTLHCCKEEWNEWDNEFKKKYNIYPLGKWRTQEIDQFLHGIKLVILNFYAHILTRKYSEIIDKTNNSSLEKIKNLDINHFDQIIFQSSSREGVLEEETFVRLYRLFHNEDLMKEIKKDKDIKKITKILKDINKIEIRYFPEHRKDIKDILKDDRYEDADFLNKNHMPIASGDIFCSNNNDYYILLAQPCDILLRTNKRKISEAALVKIVKKNSSMDFLLREIRKSFGKIFEISDEEDFKKTKKEELNRISFHLENFSKTGKYYPLEYFKGEKETYYIDFGEVFASNLLPLDLCSLNISGECKFTKNENYELDKNTSLGFENHIKLIKEKYEEINDRDEIPKIFLNKSLEGLHEDDTVSYPLKRVGRLKDPYLSDILIRFSNHISRIGFEHDLKKV